MKDRHNFWSTHDACGPKQFSDENQARLVNHPHIKSLIAGVYLA